MLTHPKCVFDHHSWVTWILCFCRKIALETLFQLCDWDIFRRVRNWDILERYVDEDDQMEAFNQIASDIDENAKFCAWHRRTSCDEYFRPIITNEGRCYTFVNFSHNFFSFLFFECVFLLSLFPADKFANFFLYIFFFRHIFVLESAEFLWNIHTKVSLSLLFNAFFLATTTFSVRNSMKGIFLKQKIVVFVWFCESVVMESGKHAHIQSRSHWANDKFSICLLYWFVRSRSNVWN